MNQYQKNNELIKLKVEIRQVIQKIEEKKQQNKIINDYTKLIQSIKNTKS